MNIGAAQDQPRQAVDRVEVELRVQRLLQQLESADRNQRDAAESALIELGEDVLPLLPQITPETSAETKERIERIRESMDQQTLESVMEPSRITLSGKLSLADALAQIEQQTGNRVVDYRDRFGQQPTDTQLDFDFDQLEFWPALDQLLDQAGLTTYSYTGEPRTLGLVAANPEQSSRAGSAAYAGIFRFEPTEIQAQRNFRLPNSAALRIRLEALWEPRVQPVLIRQPFAELEITTDDGSSVAVISPDGSAEIPVQSTVAGVDMILPLQLPNRSVKRIARLKGRCFALVPGREETFEFSDLASARNVAKQNGGIRVILDRVRQNGSIYEFRIRLQLLNQNDRFQSHLDWASNNVVTLVNSQGKTLENPNFERYMERDREIGFGYLFPVTDSIDDYRLIYRTPAALLTVPVEYELTDISLP